MRRKLLSPHPDLEGDAAGKRYPLHLRTTRSLRERLGCTAAESGRSLAQEVEVRLETSFVADVLKSSVGGAINFAIGLRVAHLLDDYELTTGRHWSTSAEDTQEALNRVVRALPRLLSQPITALGSTDPAVQDDAALMDVILAQDDGAEVVSDEGEDLPEDGSGFVAVDSGTASDARPTRPRSRNPKRSE